MNQVLKVVLTTLFAASGPIAAWLISKGVPSDQASSLVTALQPVLIAATPTAAAWFMGILNTIDARIKGIKSLPPAAATAAVASLPPEAVTAIKVATMPDKAILAAANAMPGVSQVIVKDTATDGVADAAADKALPKVVTQTDAAKP